MPQPASASPSLSMLHQPAAAIPLVLAAGAAYCLYARRASAPLRRGAARRTRSVDGITPARAPPAPPGLLRKAVVAVSAVVGGVVALVVHAAAVAGALLLAPVMKEWRRRRLTRVRVRDGGGGGATAARDAGGREAAVSVGKGGSAKHAPPAFFAGLMVPGMQGSELGDGVLRGGRRRGGGPGGMDRVDRELMWPSRRKTLVLDLDETLVHSQFKMTESCDMRLDVVVDAFPAVFYVSKRPYLDVFLRTTALWYNLVIYTASLQKYADPLISSLDPDGLVQQRLFRPHCRRQAGNFVKDLALVEPDLRDVVILDNSPAAYSMHDANAIPVEAWYDDQKDEELLNLLPLLHALAFLEDVRSLLTLRLSRGTLAARQRGSSSSSAGRQ